MLYKINCRTKIQLANEIDDYTKKLVEDYEDLDKMSIQADIWHSKFKASRYVVVCTVFNAWCVVTAVKYITDV